MERLTARESGVIRSSMPTGRFNAITDVEGVRVGQVTLIRGEGKLVPGEGPVRTGVTAVLPHGGDPFFERVPTGIFVLHGQGKSVGLAQVQEYGYIDAPIMLTGTRSVWRVADAVVDWAVRRNPGHGIDLANPNPVVGECSEAYLNDEQGRHIGPDEVFESLETADGGPVDQGCVGAGTATVCYGWKGGIGTSSRVTPEGYTLGCLVQTNFGVPQSLTISGVRVGEHLAARARPSSGASNSVMVILATDAPMLQRQLERIGKRAALGLARTGTHSSITSGDFCIAFSTAQTITFHPEAGRGGSEPEISLRVLDDYHRATNNLFRAAVETTEEAVYNSMFKATDMTGRDGRLVRALPADEVQEMIKRNRAE